MEKIIGKNKVILVNPSLNYFNEISSTTVYPLASLMIFETMLNGAGYELVFIDGNRYTVQKTISLINKSIDESVIYIGFTVMTCQVHWVYKVIKAIKLKNKDVKIVLGGYHPTIYPEETIKCEYIDVLALNEFTQHIMLLTKCLKNEEDLSKVPNIAFKKGNQIIKTAPGKNDDLKEIPFIAFDLFDIDYYKKNNILSKMLGEKYGNLYTGFIITGLGCAYKCNFCYNAILKRNYRFRSAEDIFDRIEFLHKKYGIKYVQILDDNFFINKKRILRLLELLEGKKDINVLFRVWCSAQYFNERYIDVNIAKRLKDIGFENVVLGLESGVNSTLKLLNKPATLNDNKNAIRTLSEARIIPRASFMVGIPGESAEDILQTFRFAIKMKERFKTFDPEILFFVPYPGSPLFNIAVEKYDLTTPKSFEEWASVNYASSAGTGAMFFAALGNPWVPDRVKLLRMLKWFYMLKVIDEIYDVRKGIKYIIDIFRDIIIIRFDLGFFLMPIDLLIFDFAKGVFVRFKKHVRGFVKIR